MNNEVYNGSKNITIDEEQLKIIVGQIKKQSGELNQLKDQSDVLWEQLSPYLGESVTSSINSMRDDNRKKYYSAIEELNNYANKLESISNIWKDAEVEITTSAKNLESLFSDIGKTMQDTVYRNK